MHKEWKQKIWFKAPDGTRGSNALVAREAGVTSGTVYNSFLSPEKVIPETRQRVFDAVKKLDYTYNEMPTAKMCTSCKTIKPFEEFYISYNRKYSSDKKYPNSKCKVCDSTRHKKYRSENVDLLRSNQLASFRRSKYGLTEEQYSNMISNQNNRCAICDKPSHKTLHIDHDHETGKVRGLLCSNCNTGIGFFKEDINAMKKAIKYLSNNVD